MELYETTVLETYAQIEGALGKEEAADLLCYQLASFTTDIERTRSDVMAGNQIDLAPATMDYETAGWLVDRVKPLLSDPGLTWAEGLLPERPAPSDLRRAIVCEVNSLYAESGGCDTWGTVRDIAYELARNVEYEDDTLCVDEDALARSLRESFGLFDVGMEDWMLDRIEFGASLSIGLDEGSLALIESFQKWHDANFTFNEAWDFFCEPDHAYLKIDEEEYRDWVRPEGIGTQTVIDLLCESQGTTLERVANDSAGRFEKSLTDEIVNACEGCGYALTVMGAASIDQACAAALALYATARGIDAPDYGSIDLGCERNRVNVGLYDRWSGAGGMMEIDFDLPVSIPLAALEDAVFTRRSLYDHAEYRDSQGRIHPQECFQLSNPYPDRIDTTLETIDIDIDNPSRAWGMTR